jgi:hypothetical protein
MLADIQNTGSKTRYVSHISMNAVKRFLDFRLRPSISWIIISTELTGVFIRKASVLAQIAPTLATAAVMQKDLRK